MAATYPESVRLDDGGIQWDGVACGVWGEEVKDRMRLTWWVRRKSDGWDGMRHVSITNHEYEIIIKVSWPHIILDSMSSSFSGSLTHLLTTWCLNPYHLLRSFPTSKDMTTRRPTFANIRPTHSTNRRSWSIQCLAPSSSCSSPLSKHPCLQKRLLNSHTRLWKCILATTPNRFMLPMVT